MQLYNKIIIGRSDESIVLELHDRMCKCHVYGLNEIQFKQFADIIAKEYEKLIKKTEKQRLV